MTVHKSKGLEYHTVVFLGLEDAAFREFAAQSEDERRAFFVAFSRAKQRVLFTFCALRARKAGDTPTRQTLGAIRSLYDLLLRDAGVRAVDHRPPQTPSPAGQTWRAGSETRDRGLIMQVKAHSDVELVTVNEKNCDGLPEELERWMQYWLRSW